jgi:regulator of nonsense transcripts 2
MKRKRAVQNLDARQVAMLDNAYYQCNPPERPAIPPKEYTLMELFIRHVMYDLLNARTCEKVLKLVRKLHWEEPLVRSQLP